jgi:hypothetical protein
MNFKDSSAMSKLNKSNLINITITEYIMEYNDLVK